MRRLLFLFVIAVLAHLAALPQATSLTIDCQTPGWLSSMINYGDQQTVVNLTVSGYLNKSDLTFIKNLIKNYSLHGVIDLENAIIVETNNQMPKECLGNTNRIVQKFIYPKSIESVEYPGCFIGTRVDTIVWTNSDIEYLNIGRSVPSRHMSYITDGIQRIGGFSSGMKYIMPSTVSRITEFGYEMTIFSMIENPQSVYARHEQYIYQHSSEYAAIINSKFYIPKGTMEKYLQSDFALMKWGHHNVNGVWVTESNNNTFIEYYDVDSTTCDNFKLIYKGDIDSMKIQIYPDANLVSWVNYRTSNSDIVSISPNGIIHGLDYGVSIITVTPHLIIDGLETKTASCLVRVIQHPEGVLMDSTFDVHIGETKHLIARTLPLNTTDDNVIYSSNNPSIASVSENGMVTGESRGSCIIKATSVDGGFSAECKVNVLLAVDGVTMEKHSLSLNVGESEQLYANIHPVNADNKKFIWSTSDSEIAEVDADGNVTAKKCGVAYVKATSVDNPLASDSCKVTVLQPVAGISLNYNTVELHNIGETVQLVATVLPEDASNKEVRWVSSNQSVCMVANGTIVAVGYGTSVIIATTVDGSYMATCTVTVVEGADLHGDVNHDGEVNIADINTIIDIILGGNVEDQTRKRADVNGDGEVNIADINAIIDIILSH